MLREQHLAVFILIIFTNNFVSAAQPADIIIVVDNSSSMALEASQVKAHVNSLVAPLAGAGIDTHAIIISKTSDTTTFDILETGVCAPAPLGSGACPDDENLPSYRHLIQEVSSTDALQQIINTYDDWKDQLRCEATQVF